MGSRPNLSEAPAALAPAPRPRLRDPGRSGSCQVLAMARHCSWESQLLSFSPIARPTLQTKFNLRSGGLYLNLTLKLYFKLTCGCLNCLRLELELQGFKSDSSALPGFAGFARLCPSIPWPVQAIQAILKSDLKPSDAYAVRGGARATARP